MVVLMRDASMYLSHNVCAVHPILHSDQTRTRFRYDYSICQKRRRNHSPCEAKTKFLAKGQTFSFADAKWTVYLEFIMNTC